MAKKTISGVNVGLVGESTVNYIKQISDGTTAHDLALTKGISFFNGNDGDAIVWDGTQAIEVVIPTLADIVSNPVTLKGVIDDAEDIPSSASNGDLYYIGTDGVTIGGQLCEAGDMAVYYNNAWHVISGENQITINAAAATVEGNDNLFTISGTPKTLLTVEGKTLSVALDYADVRSKIKVVKNASYTLPLTDGVVTVSGMTIALSKVADSSEDISTAVSIDLPTALKSGNVTIADKVLTASDVNSGFTAGSFPTITKNSASTLSTSHNLSIGKLNAADGATGDYVTAIDAIKAVSLDEGTSGDFTLKYVSGISASTGAAFVNGIHAWTNADAETAPDFTVPGVVTADAAVNTFVTGLEDSASGLVSSIAVGTVSIVEGQGILTGVSTDGSDFVSSVTFGSVVEDTSASLFVKGLADGSDVVTDVTVGAVSLVADNNAGSNAIVSASVSDHVLSFTTSKFMTPVAISQATTTVSKKGLVKSGVKLSGFDSTMGGFTTGALNQATTTVSYKSLTTAAVTLSQDAAVKYYLDKGNGATYEPVYGYKKLITTEATVSKNSPKLENTTITVNVPADTYAVALEGGTLPSLTIDSATGTISGTVGTELTTSNVSWLGVNATKKKVTIPGAYSLTSASDAEGAITVAAAGSYGVDDGIITIAASTYITSVGVDGTAVSVKA